MGSEEYEDQFTASYYIFRAFCTLRIFPSEHFFNKGFIVTVKYMRFETSERKYSSSESWRGGMRWRPETLR